MYDYVSGDGLSDEETEVQLTIEMQHFAMFASEDPNTFEEVGNILKMEKCYGQGNRSYKQKWHMGVN